MVIDQLLRALVYCFDVLIESTHDSVTAAFAKL